MTSAGLNGRISIEDFRHEALGVVGSTNADALERARAGDQGNVWLTATAQTGGRGRRGRTWSSEPGNLYSSLLLIDPAPLESLPSLPLAVAIAVHDAVRAVLPVDAPALEIKWPNDILIGRKKVCGILLEGERLPDGRQALAIGIGVNIVVRPELAGYPVVSLGEVGASVSPQELFARLFETMAEALALWDQGRGVASVVARWREAACGVGEKITVNLPDRSISGYFSGIDDKGMLLLDREGESRMTIAAGDVFFGEVS
ncbi:biotin--[acetyl-CoA-carboxylase] ligase [Agrobacterium sp. ES01]|uniref:biotin--[acetyl-CoA-carboxylase] ligase n=1 Tax=Agrobacterium sp. ES01 TaxID=3420714 RepID=UPI003D0A7BB9